MRILHVLPKFSWGSWSGAEASVDALCTWLVAQGHDVEVLAARIEGDTTVEHVNGYTIRRFDALHKGSVRPLAMEDPRTVSGAGIWAPGLLAYVARAGGDPVIHIHVHNRLATSTAWVARMRGLRRMLTLHSRFDPELIPSWPRSLLSVDTLFRSVGAVTTQADAGGRLVSLRYPHLKVVVVPNPVPVSALGGAANPSDLWPLPQGLRCLVLGRLLPVKNQVLAVRAVSELLSRGVEAQLVIAGREDAAYAASVRGEIALLGVGERVSLAGSLTPGDSRLDSVLRESDCLVIPSLSENQPLVMLEAWARGVPVVVSDVPSMASSVAQSQGGLVFALDHGPESLANELEVLARDAQVGRSLGAAGRDWVRLHHSTSIVGREYLRLYGELLR